MGQSPTCAENLSTPIHARKSTRATTFLTAYTMSYQNASKSLATSPGPVAGHWEMISTSAQRPRMSTNGRRQNPSENWHMQAPPESVHARGGHHRPVVAFHARTLS